ncbi:MAG TPA: tetratricopeptide repeat protein [Devosia sp.]|jgi:Flp pilus assembly protein TadD|nr:tetratricopeptide repeat protein [Devosia sp.]
MKYRALGTGLALAVALPLLAGCSSLSGMSSYAGKPQQVAVLPNIGDYTADVALAEAKGHFRSGDYGHSAALYKRVVELSPKDAEGYIGLSASYDRLKRFDLSDRVYASLFQITGGTAQYYNNVGYSYMLRGNLTAALTNFRKAERLDPGNAVVANNIQILANAAAGARA